MSEIRVAVDKIRRENEALASAIDTFKKYDRAYIESMVGSLSDMHSDYINLLKKTLESVADTKAPKLVKHAQEYSSAIRNSVNAFDNKDKDIANKFQKQGD